MSEVQAAPLAAGAPELDRSTVVRTLDRISAAAGFISSIGLAAMTLIVCYEVVSRFVFNSPTTWVIEIGTYLFVAIVFLGLAAAQRANAHIQVEILVDQLDKNRRAFIELIGSAFSSLSSRPGTRPASPSSNTCTTREIGACSARRNGYHRCR